MIYIVLAASIEFQQPDAHMLCMCLHNFLSSSMLKVFLVFTERSISRNDAGNKLYLQSPFTNRGTSLQVHSLIHLCLSL
jgi:hypothetical protein